MMKRNVAEIDMGISVARIVGADPDDRHRQFPAAPAIEKIDQAMIEARDKDEDALSLVARAQRPGHRERFDDGGEARAQIRKPDRRSRGVESDAHEEVAGLGVVELLRVENIRAILVEAGRYCGDDAGPVRA